MYLLEYKPEKVHASDEKSLKMNHATFALDSAATTPSSGKKTRWSDLAKLYFAMQKVSHNTQKKCKFHINQCPSYPHQYPLPRHYHCTHFPHQNNCPEQLLPQLLVVGQVSHRTRKQHRLHSTPGGFSLLLRPCSLWLSVQPGDSACMLLGA